MVQVTLERYSWHLILKEIEYRRQRKLSKARVMIIGAGSACAPAVIRATLRRWFMFSKKHLKINLKN